MRKTKPKQEGIATRLLRAELRLEIFCPKIRFKRARSTGVAWVNEAMFPGYLFVRFVYPQLHRRIAATTLRNITDYERHQILQANRVTRANVRNER